MTVKITTLVEDNQGENKDLESVHGLSFLIEEDDNKYLFDLAQNDLTVKNAEKLGHDLSQLDKVIISHNHYDHAGGLKDLIANFGPQNIIIQQEFFKEKYFFNKGSYKNRGTEYSYDSLLKTGSNIEKISSDINYLSENVFTAANFERKTDFEKPNKHFYVKDKGQMRLDYFKDEIALGIKSPEGLIILLGCSHPGVVNIIASIIKRTGIDNIHCILGGTHLVKAGNERIEKTLKYIKSLDPDCLGLSHCTGQKAEEIFEKEMPQVFFHNHTGSVVEIA